MKISIASAVLCAASMTAISTAAYDPANGEWGKDDPRELRVMTWNVLDGIRSGAPKTEGSTQWSGIAHVIAAMQPDVIIFQELGDHGFFNGVDTPAELTTVFDMLFHGGTDTFNGNTPITSWVQKYAPGYDLPFVFASTITDSFNRNAIISRYPFVDLNGDGKTTISDIAPIIADEYAPGGNGGIRGFAFAEIDLPDADYAGDLVLGNAHLKAGGSSSDKADRLEAAKNVTYYVDYIFNGAGTGTPDPNISIFDAPAVQNILGDNTAVILGGDLNEDENTNGRKGPPEWLQRAQNTGGTDGTDRDRTDGTFDDAREPFSNSRVTQNSNSKLDYLIWQDSVATSVREFVFYSNSVPTINLPPEFAGLPLGGLLISSVASDHRPVIVDFLLPAPVANPCPWDLDGDGSVGAGDLATLLGSWGPGAGAADFDMDGAVGASDLAVLLGAWGPCP